MHLRPLGLNGPLVTELCFGTLTMGPLQKNLPLSEGAALLEAAFARGVRFFDTAEIYGTYPYIREGLKGTDAIIATKCYAVTADDAERSFRLAAEGMGREHIDIFMLHEQESAHTLRGHREALDYFAMRKRAGDISLVGVSTHYIACVRAAAHNPGIDVIFPLINIDGIGIADGSAPQMAEAIRDAASAGKGIFVMKPLGGGHLIARREQALDYARAVEGSSAVALGIQTMAELDYAVRYFSDESIDDALRASVDRAPRRLCISFCTGCGQCVSACRNGAMRLADGQARVDEAKCALCGYCARACEEFCIKVV